MQQCNSAHPSPPVNAPNPVQHISKSQRRRPRNAWFTWGGPANNQGQSRSRMLRAARLGNEARLALPQPGLSWPTHTQHRSPRPHLSAVGCWPGPRHLASL